MNAERSPLTEAHSQANEAVQGAYSDVSHISPNILHVGVSNPNERRAESSDAWLRADVRYRYPKKVDGHVYQVKAARIELPQGSYTAHLGVKHNEESQSYETEAEEVSIQRTGYGRTEFKKPEHRERAAEIVTKHAAKSIENATDQVRKVA